ncbi:unnamed protein product [Allacma fusca]|uniref:DUF7042 domain-containing protein n=1 Tax=Allacma fusca TaxID=39272 RepID=A0A8J2KU04_9HEXA|nr:unnamed protein product [Allacma fusca]
MQYRHHASYEERYRCFVYEKTKKGGGTGQYNNSDSNIIVRVAQSGDATCNGLSPSEGSRTMTLRKGTTKSPLENKFP